MLIMLSIVSSMLLIKFNYQHALQLALMGTGSFLLFTPFVKAQPFADGSTPKIFICPKEMTRFATLLTNKHDINICGQEGAKPTVLALRLRNNPQAKVVNIPILSSKNSLYVACSNNGTYYKLNTDNKLLTIQPKKSRVFKEKVVASD